MTKWKILQLVFAWISIALGLAFFVSFVYFGMSYVVTPDEFYLQGLDMVVWMSLLYSFSFFIVPAIIAYSLRKTLSTKLFKVLISPVMISGVFVAGIPIVQVL